MNNLSDFDKVFASANNLMQRQAKAEEYFQSTVGLEHIENTDLSFDRMSNLDVAFVDRYHANLREPRGDAFSTLKSFTRMNRQVGDAAMRGTDADSLFLRGIASGNVGDFLNEQLALHMENTFKNSTPGGTPDWQFSLVTQSLVANLEGLTNERIEASRGQRGVTALPMLRDSSPSFNANGSPRLIGNFTTMEPAQARDVHALTGLDHASAYARVAQKATTSLSVNFYQHEHSALLAETVVAMQRVSGSGGRFQMNLSRPDGVTIGNSLTMAVMRRYGPGQDIGYDTRGTAHQKFMGANLDAGGIREEQAFALGSANATSGALGPLMRDGVFTGATSNTELTFYADHGLVTSGQMDDSTYDKLMSGAKMAQDYAEGKRSTLTLGDSGFFMDGTETGIAVNELLHETAEFMRGGSSGGPQRSSTVSFLLDAVTPSGWEAHSSHKTGPAALGIRENLRNLSVAMGEHGRIEILMDRLNSSQWQQRIKQLGLSEEAVRNLRATGDNLTVLKQILGLGDLDNVHLVDNHGSRQHAKALFSERRTAGAATEYEAVFGSSNPTGRGFDRNRQINIGMRINSSQHTGLGTDMSAFRSRHGMSLNYKGTYDPNSPDAPGTIYSTPFTAGILSASRMTDVMTNLNVHKTMLQNLGYTSTLHRAHSGKVPVMTVGGRMAGTQIDNLVQLEMHAQENGSIYMPQYHKTVHTSLLMSTVEGVAGYGKVDKLDATSIIGDALHQTMHHLETRVIQHELRAIAFQRLSQMEGTQNISTRAIDQYVGEMTKQVYVQQMLKTRAQAFMLSRLGAFEAEPIGRYAYAGKSHQGLAFTRNKKTGMLEHADVSFRANAFQGERSGSAFFQRGSDSSMVRRNRIDPLTGLPEETVGKIYGPEAFDQLPISTVTRTNDQDYTTIAIPFNKILQLSARLGNIFASSIHTQYTRNSHGQLVKAPSYKAPMQMGDQSNGPLELYRYNVLLHYGANIDNDIAYGNARRYARMSYGIERPALLKLDPRATASGPVLEMLNSLTGQELHGETIHLGTSYVDTIYGRKAVNLTMKNPAATIEDSNGFAVIERIGHSASATDPNKTDLRVQMVVHRNSSGGMRHVVGGIKAVVVMLNEDGIQKIYENSNLAGSGGHAASHWLGMGSHKDVDLIVNSSQIKHGEMLWQTGAHLLQHSGGGDYFDAIWKNLDQDAFLKTMQHETMPFEEAVNQGRNGFYGDVAHIKQTTGFRIHDLVRRDKASFAKAARDLFAEIRKGDFLNVAHVDHQVTSSLAWFMWQQLHHQQAALNNGAAMRQGHMDNFSWKNKTMMGLADVLRSTKIREMQKSMGMTEDDAERAFNRGFYVPAIMASALSSNTVALSGRPEAQLLQYMNISENSALFSALFPDVNPAQKAMLHIASLDTHGFGSMGGRRQQTVMYGTLNAAVAAVRVTAGNEERVGGLAKGLNLLQQAETQNEFNHALSLLPTDGASFFNESVRLDTAVSATVDVTTGMQNVHFETILTTFKHAGIGALSIIIPDIKMTKTIMGYKGTVVGHSVVRLPDFEALMSLINGKESTTQDAAHSLINILEIFGTEHSLLNSFLNLDAEQFLHFSNEKAAQLNKMATNQMAVQSWYHTIQNSDHVRAIFGGEKGPGVTFTVATDSNLAPGFIVQGRTTFKRSLQATRDAFERSYMEDVQTMLGEKAPRGQGETKLAWIERHNQAIREIHGEAVSDHYAGVEGPADLPARTGFISLKRMARTMMQRDLGIFKDLQAIRKTFGLSADERSEWYELKRQQHMLRSVRGTVDGQFESLNDKLQLAAASIKDLRWQRRQPGSTPSAFEPAPVGARGSGRVVYLNPPAAGGAIPLGGARRERQGEAYFMGPEIKAKRKQVGVLRRTLEHGTERLLIQTQLGMDTTRRVSGRMVQDRETGSWHQDTRYGGSPTGDSGYHHSHTNNAVERIMGATPQADWQAQTDTINGEQKALGALRGTSSRRKRQTITRNATGSLGTLRNRRNNTLNQRNQIDARQAEIKTRLGEMRDLAGNFNEAEATSAFESGLNSVFDRYPDMMSSIAVDIGDGVVSQVDLKSLKEFRRARARKHFQDLVESAKAEADPHAAKHKFMSGVTDILTDLALTNPDHFTALGGRAGGPLGSEFDVGHIIGMDDFNAILAGQHGGQKADGTKYTMDELIAGEGKYSLAGNENLVLMSSTAQGLQLGDYDGDMASLRHATRYNLLKTKQRSRPKSMSSAETASLLEVESKLLEASSGRSFVASVAKYTMNHGLLEAFDKGDRTAKAGVMSQAAMSLSQTRGLYSNFLDYTATYQKAYKASDSTLGTAQRHQLAAQSAMQTAIAKVGMSLTLPTEISSKRFRFIQEYTGFAGTEIIGKGFNSSYSLMMSAAALNNQGVFQGQGNITREGLGDVTNSVGEANVEAYSQMKGLGGFIKTMNQMYRDSLKPKNMQMEEIFRMMKSKGHGVTGAYAAMDNVGGVRTIAYLNAITRGETTVRNLFNETISDHKGANAAKQTQRDFVDIASREMAKFAYDEHYAQGDTVGGMLDEVMKTRMDTIKEVLDKRGTDAQRAMLTDGTLELDSTGSRARVVAALKDIEIDVEPLNKEGSIFKSKSESITLAEHLLGMHYKDELGMTFSGTENAEEFMAKRKKGDISGHEFDLIGLDQIMVIGKESRAFKAGAMDSNSMDEFLGMDEYGDNYDVRSKVAGLTDMMARPSTQSNTSAVMRMMANLSESHFGMEAETWNNMTKEQKAEHYKTKAGELNSISHFDNTLGDTLASYHQQHADSNARVKLADQATGQVQHSMLNDNFMRTAGAADELMMDVLQKNAGMSLAESAIALGIRKETHVARDATWLDKRAGELSKYMRPVFNEHTMAGVRNTQHLHGAGGALAMVMLGDLSHGGGEEQPSFGTGLKEAMLLNNPITMVRRTSEMDKKTQQVVAGALGAGIFAGSLAETMVRGAAKNFSKSGLVVGLLGTAANILAGFGAGMVGGDAVTKWLGMKNPNPTPTEPKGTIPSLDLVSRATNGIGEMLTQFVQGAADDVTGVMDLYDTEGNEVYFDNDSNGDPGSAGWEDEDGMPLYTEVRGGADEAGYLLDAPTNRPG